LRNENLTIFRRGWEVGVFGEKVGVFGEGGRLEFFG